MSDKIIEEKKQFDKEMFNDLKALEEKNAAMP
jgi:hypothetical protein